MIVRVRAHGERDRAFDRLDDVGEADLVRRPRQSEAARRAARAGQQAGRGELAHQFLRGREGDASVGGQARSRSAARPRGSGRRRSSERPHNRRDGSGAFQFGAFRYDLEICAGKHNLTDADECVNLYPFIRPFAFALDAEAAHRATIAALRMAPVRLAARFPGFAQGEGRRDRFPDAGRPCGRLRQGRQVPAQLLSLGFGFVEVGTVTPRAAGRKSEATPVPAGRGPGHHQPPRFQQRRPAGRVRTPAAVQPGLRGDRRQPRRQQGQQGPDRRLCRRGPLDEPRRALSDHQHQLAQHARACARFRTKARSTSCSRPSRRRGATGPSF